MRMISSALAASAGAAVLLGALISFAPGGVQAENAPVVGKKGTSPYVTHFIFRPLQSLEIPGVGTAHLLEAVGTTQNLKGDSMLDKMAARCTALNVESGDKKYIDGACALTDKDGDVIFSTFGRQRQICRDHRARTLCLQ